ncbi:Neurofibromin 1, partial [Cladochytrium tenue]
LCIPGNSQGFILSISHHLAASEKNLTLEFLIECVLGFSKSSKEQKLFCLEYMTPWLANLAMFAAGYVPQSDHGFGVGDEESAEVVAQKLKSLMKLLIEMTIQHVELFHLVQSRVWRIIGAIDDLLPLVLELLVQSAVDNGIGSQHAEIAANTIITLAQANSDLVPGKIIFRLIRCLEADAPNLVEQPIWQEVTVLIRMLLMISFNNLLDVRHFLPELCYALTLSVGLGKPLVRASVHAICVNMVHSLCTQSSLGQPTQEVLRAILDNLSSDQMMRLFNVSAYRIAVDRGRRATVQSHPALIISGDNIAGEASSSIAPWNLRSIVVEFSKILSTGAGDPDLGSDWKSRWMSLLFENAFDFTDLVQPRVLVALGVMAKQEPSPSAFVETIECLHNLLRLLDDDNNLSVAVISAIICLIDMIEGLEYIEEMVDVLKSVFWIGLNLIVIEEPAIFTVAAGLVESTIKTLDKFDAFKELGFGETLLEARENTEMDKATSIWFSADFSFAFTGLVLKGLSRSPAMMRTATQSLLRTALIAARRNPAPDFVPMNYVPDHCLGYVMALLPSHADNVAGLFKRAGLPEYLLNLDSEDAEDGWYRLVLDVLTPFADPNRPLLMVTVLVALLEMNEVDAEVSILYGLLGEITLDSPSIVSYVYETLLPRMNLVLTTSQAPALIRQVHTIYQTMMACAPQSAPTAPNFLSTPGRRSSMGSVASGGSGSGGGGATPQRQANGGSSGSGGGSAAAAAGVGSFPLYSNYLLVARLSEVGLAGLAWSHLFGNPVISAAINHKGEHVLCSLDSRNILVDLAADACRRLLRSPAAASMALGECAVRAAVPPTSKIDEELLLLL